MMPSADPTTIVLVDDNDLLRVGLREILETYQDLRVVGEAGDSETATTVVADKRPDVVVLDVEIPGADVTTTVRRMSEISPAIQVVILTMYAGERLLQGLMDWGVHACLPKSVGHKELVSTIRRARAYGRGDDHSTPDAGGPRETLGRIGGERVGTRFSTAV